MSTSDAAADPAPGPRSVTDQLIRRAAVLFMIGSTCFALPSVPALAGLFPPIVPAATYFIGSLFFTSAAIVMTISVWDRLRSLDWWAAVIQLAGTVWFNVNTFDALHLGLTSRQANLRVWTPDFLGSVCFLVSSELSLWAVCQRPWCVCRDERDWTIAMLNLAGSVAFMLAALAAYTRPATDDLLDASLANIGTLVGAICFFWGARLMLPATTDESGLSPAASR